MLRLANTVLSPNMLFKLENCSATPRRSRRQCRSSPNLSKTICVPCNNRSCGKRADEIFSNSSALGKSLGVWDADAFVYAIDLWIIFVNPFQKIFFCPFIYIAIKSFLILNVFECFLTQWVKLFEVSEEIGFNTGSSLVKTRSVKKWLRYRLASV